MNAMTEIETEMKTEMNAMTEMEIEMNAMAEMKTEMETEMNAMAELKTEMETGLQGNGKRGRCDLSDRRQKIAKKTIFCFLKTLR